MGWSCLSTAASRPSNVCRRLLAADLPAARKVIYRGTFTEGRHRTEFDVPRRRRLGININTDRRNIMSYAIVGFGKIGQALAHAFARRNIDVTVASRRPPEALAPQARAIGSTVVAKSLRDALDANTIILAVPFGEHREVAKALPSWKGKTVIDAMNSFPVPPEELDGLPSSAFVAKSFSGAKLVKGFNHLVAATLATDPIVEGGHRVVFLSSDDEDAIAPVADLAKQLGFTPVKLGRLNEGGALVHAGGRTWGPLIFQDLFKKEHSLKNMLVIFYFRGEA